MPITPQQIRAVDPYSESRFSDNYNLRSRMVTGGRDVILFPDSFAITQNPNNLEFTVGPGVAIVDDVLIHILESTTFDLSSDDDAMMDASQTSPPIPTDETNEFYLDLYIYYKHARTIPAPSARMGLIRRGLNDPIVGPGGMLPIAYITVEVSITNIIQPPSLWETDVNCGVIRMGTLGLAWYTEWLGDSPNDEPLTIVP